MCLDHLRCFSSELKRCVLYSRAFLEYKDIFCGKGNDGAAAESWSHFGHEWV